MVFEDLYNGWMNCLADNVSSLILLKHFLWWCSMNHNIVWIGLSAKMFLLPMSCFMIICWSIGISLSLLCKALTWIINHPHMHDLMVERLLNCTKLHNIELNVWKNESRNQHPVMNIKNRPEVIRQMREEKGYWMNVFDASCHNKFVVCNIICYSSRRRLCSSLLVLKFTVSMSFLYTLFIYSLIRSNMIIYHSVMVS